MMKKFFFVFILISLGLVSCNDKDNNPVVVKSIDCEESEISLYPYENKEVTITISPENAEDKDYGWEIIDPNIASVEGNVFTGKMPGETWAIVFNTLRPEIRDSLKITIMEIPKKSVNFDDENICYEGRVEIGSEAVSYLYPGSSIITEFTGTSINGKFNAVKDVYYWVEVDDQKPYKLCVRKKTNYIENSGTNPGTFWLAQNLKPGNHTLRITLCSEGIYKNPKFYGFEIDENAELMKPAEKTVKFEFIGNSITCGYGTEVTNRAAFNDSTSNFCHGFAYLVSKEFNAQLMVVARSGIGVYRNYGDAETASEYGCLPDNYEKTWLQNTKNWDFTKYTPDVIFINLGTNDTWDLDNTSVKESTFNDEKYEANYKSLLDKIFSHYSNNPKVVLLTGCMMGQQALDRVKPILNTIQSEYNAKGHTIYRFDFSQQIGLGADWHPCAAQQKTMSEELIPFLKENHIVD